MQLAIVKDMRNKNIGSTLLNYIKRHYSKTSSITNIDDSFESIHYFFEKRGLKKFLQQIEMKWEIPQRIT